MMWPDMPRLMSLPIKIGTTNHSVYHEKISHFIGSIEEMVLLCHNAVRAFTACHAKGTTTECTADCQPNENRLEPWKHP